MRSNAHEWLGRELKRGSESFGEETQYGTVWLAVREAWLL